MNIEDDKINGEELNNILQFPKKESKQFKYMSYEEYNDNQHRLADDIFRDHATRLNKLENRFAYILIMMWIMFILVNLTRVLIK